MSSTAVEIPGYVAGTYTIDPDGGTRGGFSATTELDRGDFGIGTNILLDGGGVVLGHVSRSSSRSKPC
jgi:polyisoprenoid-binding protein YceI